MIFKKRPEDDPVLNDGARTHGQRLPLDRFCVRLAESLYEGST